MAKTQSVEYPDELDTQEGKALEHRDRYELGVTQASKSLKSRRQQKRIREMSLFGYLAQFWNQLSPSQKDTWRQAAEFSDLTNWQLYISDNAARIRNELPLDVPPSDLWQVRAGRILIESPADGILLKQEHPESYWTAPQVVGKSWKRHLVKLQENFSLPLNLAIRYKSDLTAAPGYAVPVADQTISGTVTLNGNPVQGATIRCIRQSDNTAIATETTDANGDYEFTGLTEDEVYHLLVEYESGGQKYNAFGYPDRSWLETDFELQAYSAPSADAADFDLSTYGAQVPTARYIARVWHSYQGVDYRTDFSIDMSPNVDWTLGQETVDNVRGIIVGYTLYIDVNGYRGEILFDNVRAEHSGTNWARDPRADDVDKSFTGPFSVVAPYWEGEEVPEGAQFFSDYPPAITS